MGSSGLSELEQLHVKPNSDCSRQVDIVAPLAAGDGELGGPGNKAKVLG